MVGISNSTGQLDLADYYRMLERRIARLERGTANSPSTDVTVIATLAITGLALSTQTVVVDGDNYRVYLRYSWTAVPNDPSEYNKDALDGYLTSYSLDGTHWTAELFTTDTFLDVGPFTQSQVVTFRVRARSIKGTLGAYSTINNTTTADSTAPFQPSTPTVSPYLGQLAIDWNGLDVSSNPMPTDFRFCEVHLSTSGPTFTPSVATLVGTILRGGGTWVATDLPYGTLQYSRLVAVDTVGNRSVTSTAGSGTPVQANDGDIAALSVGKLTAGVITAVMTITGRLATSLTGARVEMNSTGIQAFNSGGQQTVSIASATGAVQIAGTFKTAFSGVRLEMTNATDRSTIEFYGTAAVDPAFINSPTDGSGAPRLGLNTGPFTYNSLSSKHRVFMNNASGIQIETYTVAGGITQGGRVGLGDVFASIDVRSTTNVVRSQLTMGTTFLNLDLQNSSGSVNGGHLEESTIAIKINSQNAGTVSSEIALFDDASIWISGGFTSDNSISGKSALYCNTWAINTTSSDFIISYGVTMSSKPMVIYAFVRSGSNGTGDRISAMSTTGFTIHVNSSSTDYTNLNYWAFRVI